MSRAHGTPAGSITENVDGSGRRYMSDSTSRAKPSIADPSNHSPAARTAEPKTIQQVNSARAAMHGVNQRPLHAGAVTNQHNGGLTVKTAAGHEYAVRPNGTLKTYSNGTQSVNFRSNGRVATIHRPEIDIRRGAAGQRTIVSRRPDRSVLVSTAPHQIGRAHRLN